MKMIRSSFFSYPPPELQVFPHPSIVKQRRVSEDREDTSRVGRAQQPPLSQCFRNVPKCPGEQKAPGQPEEQPMWWR